MAQADAMQILTVKGGMEALNALLLKDTRGKRYNRRKELMDDLADEVAYEFGDKQPPRDGGFVQPKAPVSRPAPLTSTTSSAVATSSSRAPTTRKPSAIVTALAYERRDGNGVVYCSCTDHSLWKYTISDQSWLAIGAAQKVVAMAYDDGILYALDRTNNIWQMQLHGKQPTWLPFKPYADAKLVSITACSGYIFGATKTNKLVKKKIGDASGVLYSVAADTEPWRQVGECLEVVGLTAWNSRLYACCANLTMWSMDLNAPPGGAVWQDAGRAPFPLKQGFVAFEARLHAADADKMWSRPLGPLEKWSEFSSLPQLQAAAPAAAPSSKRARDEIEEIAFEGDVTKLKQWRLDLVGNMREAKAEYEKALAEIEKWRDDVATLVNSK